MFPPIFRVRETAGNTRRMFDASLLASAQSYLSLQQRQELPQCVSTMGIFALVPQRYPSPGHRIGVFGQGLFAYGVADAQQCGVDLVCDVDPIGRFREPIRRCYADDLQVVGIQVDSELGGVRYHRCLLNGD